MSVVCVAWSSHVGALMSAASRPGMPSVRVLSSRMLEDPDGVERCLEIMRSATALFVFRTTDALWDQLDEGIRLIGKTVPVVCVSYDPAEWVVIQVNHVLDRLVAVRIVPHVSNLHFTDFMNHTSIIAIIKYRWKVEY